MKTRTLSLVLPFRIAMLFALSALTLWLLVHPAFSATSAAPSKIPAGTLINIQILDMMGDSCSQPRGNVMVDVVVNLSTIQGLSNDETVKRALEGARVYAFNNCAGLRNPMQVRTVRIFIFSPQHQNGQSPAVSMVLNYASDATKGWNGHQDLTVEYSNNVRRQAEAEKQDAAKAARIIERRRAITSQYPRIYDGFADECVFWGKTPQQCWGEFRLLHPHLFR